MRDEPLLAAMATPTRRPRPINGGNDVELVLELPACGNAAFEIGRAAALKLEACKALLLIGVDMTACAL